MHPVYWRQFRVRRNREVSSTLIFFQYCTLVISHCDGPIYCRASRAAASRSTTARFSPSCTPISCHSPSSSPAHMKVICLLSILVNIQSALILPIKDKFKGEKQLFLFSIFVVFTLIRATVAWCAGHYFLQYSSNLQYNRVPACACRNNTGSFLIMLVTVYVFSSLILFRYCPLFISQFLYSCILLLYI